MDPTDADLRAFRDLAFRYARSADSREYQGFAEITTEDAVIGIHHGDPATEAPIHEMRGHTEILAAMPGLEQYSKTMHYVANQQVAISDEDRSRASGETYCQAHHLYEHNGATWDHVMHIRYQDRYEKREGRWLFSERRLWVIFTSDQPIAADGAPS